MSSTTPVLEEQSPLERRLGHAVRACLVGAGVAAVGGGFGLLLLWGGVVMPGWAISASLLLVTAGLALVRALLGHRARRGPRWPRRRWGLLAVATGVVSGILALGDLGATYTVLPSSGPGTCRAVVREHSFLFAGSGDLYVVGPTGLGRPVSSWTADDGYEPVASGTYDFGWVDGEAHLSVSGRPGDPVWPSQHAFRCP